MKILDRSGFSAVLVTISFAVILGFASLVIDIGLSLYEKEKLSNAVDAAALAGILDIKNGEQNVIQTAKQYGEINGIQSNNLNVSISQDKQSVSVTADRGVQYYFAKIFGINNKTLSSEAKVKTAPITAYNGVRPLVIATQVFTYNMLYILKEDSGDGLSGNYGSIALGGNGSSIYENNLMFGYNGTLKVGDTINTQTGNITQSTRRGIQALIDEDPYSNYTNYSKGSSRLIVIPVVNTLDVDGKKPIYVVGFAAFFVEGLQGSGGNTDIVGRFVNFVAEGDCNSAQTDYGLEGIKLVK